MMPSYGTTEDGEEFTVKIDPYCPPGKILRATSTEVVWFSGGVQPLPENLSEALKFILRCHKLELIDADARDHMDSTERTQTISLRVRTIAPEP